MNPERMFESRQFQCEIHGSINKIEHCRLPCQKCMKKYNSYFKEESKNKNWVYKKKIHKDRDLAEVLPGKNKRSKFGSKSMINLFLKNSSIFALNRIGKSTSKRRKVFWIFILCFGIIGCVSQVGQFLSSYYKYPVVITLESRKEKSGKFPAVTLCNMNSIRREFQTCFENNLSYNKCLNSSENDEAENVLMNNSTPICNRDFYVSQIHKNIMYTTFSLGYATRKKYGHKVEDFITFCKFNGVFCYPQNFTVSLSNFYGNCFTFNPEKLNPPLRQLRPGSFYSLVFEINLEVNKYATFTDSVGARLQLHDPHVQHNTDDKGVNISPGSEINVAITKSVFSRLPAPFKDRCKKYKDGDNQDSCIDLCMHEVISSKCFCSMMTNPIDDVPSCNIYDPLVLCCIMEFYDDTVCDCPISCDETVYNMQISSTIWPKYGDDNSIKQDSKKINDSYCTVICPKTQESRLRLKIYYDTFETIIYKQRPMYQSSELLSQIGGQMGLWLGLSLIAVFECLENIIIMCKYRYKK